MEDMRLWQLDINAERAHAQAAKSFLGLDPKNMEYAATDREYGQDVRDLENNKHRWLFW